MMIIDNKRNLILVALLLGIGLVAVIFLSLRVNQETKSVLQTSAVLPPSSKEKVKSEEVSIYDLNIPFSSTGLKGEITIPKQKKTVKDKTPPGAVVPKQYIKTLEEDLAELSAGLQPKYDSSRGGSAIPGRHSTSSVGGGAADEASVDTDASRIKDLEPPQGDDSDLLRRGTILF